MGYFSYDIIRYIEKIPDRCTDDLKIPDIRLMRPKTIIMHDNLLKHIYFILNCYSDQRISNYQKYYLQQKQKIDFLKKLAFNFKYQNIIKSKNNYVTYDKNNLTSSKAKKILNLGGGLRGPLDVDFIFFYSFIYSFIHLLIY